MYPLLRPLLFRMDAEAAHEMTLGLLGWSSGHPGALRLLQWMFSRPDPRLEVRMAGLSFPNPVGLAAGMDKNAAAVPAWASLGFGAAEIGTVTHVQQEGNPRPRLFRLKEDHALINRMGFNNDGAAAVAARLAELGDAADPESARPAAMKLGVNVGKSRITGLSEAAADYRGSLGLLERHADYVAINVSSPNTPGLRELQAEDALTELLTVARAATSRPVLVKIAPDLADDELVHICRIAHGTGIDGIIATNTTVSRHGLKEQSSEAGGLSGLPLRARSLEVLRFLRRHTDLPLVSVGGIWSAHDAVQRIRAGASMVQVYTSFVYQGPGLPAAICRGIIRELERENAASVQDLIGLDA